MRSRTITPPIVGVSHEQLSAKAREIAPLVWAKVPGVLGPSSCSTGTTIHEGMQLIMTYSDHNDPLLANVNMRLTHRQEQVGRKCVAIHDIDYLQLGDAGTRYLIGDGTEPGLSVYNGFSTWRHTNDYSKLHGAELNCGSGINDVLSAGGRYIVSVWMDRILAILDTMPKLKKQK